MKCINYEETITQAVKANLVEKGYIVATEVANFHRSADIAAIGPDGRVLVVECKMSDIKRAIAQLSTHKLSADQVVVATYRRTLKPFTVALIREKGIGLIFVSSSGQVEEAWAPVWSHAAWPLRREQLRRRIMEEQFR